MNGTDDEKRFEAASATLRMVALVERFLDGRATREELCAWARDVIKSHGRSVFHGPADELHTCLWNLDEVISGSGEPLVRRVDLIEHLHAVRRGEPRSDRDEIATLTLAPHEIAARTGTAVTRVAIEGLGWFEVVRFASPATGRPFLAGGALEPADEVAKTSVRTYRYPTADDERSKVVSDLLDTLCIDIEETIWVQALPTRRWRLMRADDNGNTAVVATFTGYAKARAQLTVYEERMHKQTYWLEVEHAMS